MRKPLYAEVAKPRIGRKTYFSRKLAVILFVCAVAAGLATVITIRTTRRRQLRKEIKSLIAKCENFLSQNSPGKYFPADRAEREQAIKECRRLRPNVEASLARANDAGLKKVKSKVDEWLNLAQDAHQRYGFLESALRQFESLRHRTKRGLYPDPNIILDVEGLKDAIAKIDKANLELDYVSRVKNILYEDINRWQEEIKRVLLAKKGEVTRTIQSSELGIKPANYSEQQYQKYDRRKLMLKELEKDESLNNAGESPVEQHRKIAVEMIAKLDKGVVDCNNILQKLEGFKKEAEASFGSASEILNGRSITDGRVKNFEQLVKARSLLDTANKRWPKMPDLEKKGKKLEDEFAKNQQNMLKRWQSEIEKIRNETANELLKDFDTVRKKLENANMQNIHVILLEIRGFEEQLQEQVASISKSKQKGNKRDK